MGSCFNKLWRISASVPSLVTTKQLPDDIHCVHLDVLIVQIPVPLPVRMSAIFKRQDSVTVSWFPECGPWGLWRSTEVAIIHVCRTVTTWLVCWHCLVGCRAQSCCVSKCLVCSITNYLWASTAELGLQRNVSHNSWAKHTTSCECICICNSMTRCMQDMTCTR